MSKPLVRRQEPYVALAEMVAQVRSGKYRPPDASLGSPRQK
jgi:hypothetical protein